MRLPSALHLLVSASMATLAARGTLAAEAIDQPVESKALARAMLVRPSANVHELLLSKRRSARVELETRLEEFLAGRGTLNFLFDAMERCLDAELSLCGSKAERLAAREESWLFFLAN